MGKKHDWSNFVPVNPRYIDALRNNKKERKMFSRINNDIPVEAKVKLYQITSDYTIGDCNVKADMICDIMTSLGFVEIGCGTNRIAFRKHNYVYKVALDERGFIDNISEYKRSIEFPQYFMKVYETNREILVCEYCELVSEDYFIAHKQEVKMILSILSNHYIMEDVGLTTKNFCNWGIRTNTDGEESMVLIDNAYFYPMRNAEMITCNCGGRIVPTDDYTGYRCSNSACSLNYTAGEILNMARFDFDGEDEEAIGMMTADGKETFIKVSGTNTGTVETMDASEAERLLSTYKPATSFDASTVNIIADIENYWEENSIENQKEPEEPKYESLNL